MTRHDRVIGVGAEWQPTAAVASQAHVCEEARPQKLPWPVASGVAQKRMKLRIDPVRYQLPHDGLLHKPVGNLICDDRLEDPLEHPQTHRILESLSIALGHDDPVAGSQPALETRCVQSHQPRLRGDLSIQGQQAFQTGRAYSNPHLGISHPKHGFLASKELPPGESTQGEQDEHVVEARESARQIGIPISVQSRCAEDPFSLNGLPPRESFSQPPEQRIPPMFAQGQLKSSPHLILCPCLHHPGNYDFIFQE